ncbi:nickel pincer cofactor biosynthesis protein LarB [Pseudofrankia asymbiotica]|uniref:1-(5-phosphoribosyl)-5-amino-4-imidazole-carboxylate carboxylase n=1 Tax=Pseudofrankia asymbiotica TaxID=1834516 RepID=A0A1V2IBW7_9ACTN|nr:nickel pincer cofactor biosynthesis protein LarB [Pseudofrankia asymbiotica]ONH30575.1 1-(5-phosphoribosyl)-5-amino-4-imidazole-carboxylate carboxylase [Pseudofrankia asymbiotica]
MDTEQLRTLLTEVAAGRVDTDEAMARLAAGPLGDGAGFVDLGYARVDTHRGVRTGDPEVVYAAGKTAAETVGIVTALRAASGDGRPTLVTRAGRETVDALLARWPDATATDPARPLTTVAVGQLPPARGRVVVVCAGTSDAPVADEAALTAAASGAGVETLRDVGVAGLHRLLAVRDVLASVDCLVVVAGMEGALPSVIGGLVGVPLIAVPTSVGYGAAFGGIAALLGMLTACAPGIAVCNIDNGFGAGLFAARVARAAAIARAANVVTAGASAEAAGVEAAAGGSEPGGTVAAAPVPAGTVGPR